MRHPDSPHARATILDLVFASIGSMVDLLHSVDRARQHALAHVGRDASPLWDLLETHLASWIDALAARAGELGGDARVVLDAVPRGADAVEHELYDGPLLERYRMLCAHLRRELHEPAVHEDAVTLRVYVAVLRAAEIDRWFVEVDLAGDASSLAFDPLPLACPLPGFRAS